MTTRTISEELFEKHCAQRGIACTRILENCNRTADYRVFLTSLPVITEVKQLDLNDEDKKLTEVWGTRPSPGAHAPSDRVKGLLEKAYPQIKRSCEGTWPTLIVLFNNSGAWNWLDAFTVATAMFGSYGIEFGLQADQQIRVTRQGYFGRRKVTKNTFRALSVVGVLERSTDAMMLACYHNPFANIPIDPTLLAGLADAQYVHADPPEGSFVPWEPRKIET